MSKRYGLGVDTGGTFTDAVILDLSDFSLIAKAKSPTTPHRSERKFRLYHTPKESGSNDSIGIPV